MVYLEYDFRNNEGIFEESFVDTLNCSISISGQGNVMFELKSPNIIRGYFLSSDTNLYTKIKNTINAVLRCFSSAYNLSSSCVTVDKIYEDLNYEYNDLTVDQLYYRLRFLVEQYGNKPVKLLDETQDLSAVSVMRVCSKDTISLITKSNKIEDKCMTAEDLITKLDSLTDFDRVFIFGLKSRDTLVGVSNHKGYFVMEGKVSACFPKDKRDFM